MSNTTTTTALSPSEQLIVDSFTNSVDSLWILVTGFLVFFMQAGFAVLELGSVRSMNAQNILLKNLFDTAVGSVVWWLLGYGFAFGESSGGFIGITEFAGTGDDFSPRDWFFQWAFAGTVRACVSCISRVSNQKKRFFLRPACLVRDANALPKLSQP
jgi:Amt family ammonium transporter